MSCCGCATISLDDKISDELSVLSSTCSVVSSDSIVVQVAATVVQVAATVVQVVSDVTATPHCNRLIHSHKPSYCVGDISPLGQLSTGAR